MYGPKNIAASIVNNRLLEKMKPVLLGGGMIDYSGFVDTWKRDREKFFAGTMDIGLITAWSKACDFLTSLSFDKIHNIESLQYEKLLTFLMDSKHFCVVPGTSKSIISFYHHYLHAHDIAYALAQKNVITRAGHMCAGGILRKLEKHAITRVSFGLGLMDSDTSVLLDLLGDIDNEY